MMKCISGKRRIIWNTFVILVCVGTIAGVLSGVFASSMSVQDDILSGRYTQNAPAIMASAAARSDGLKIGDLQAAVPVNGDNMWIAGTRRSDDIYATARVYLTNGSGGSEVWSLKKDSINEFTVAAGSAAYDSASATIIDGDNFSGDLLDALNTAEKQNVDPNLETVQIATLKDQIKWLEDNVTEAQKALEILESESDRSELVLTVNQAVNALNAAKASLVGVDDSADSVRVPTVYMDILRNVTGQQTSALAKKTKEVLDKEAKRKKELGSEYDQVAGQLTGDGTAAEILAPLLDAISVAQAALKEADAEEAPRLEKAIANAQQLVVDTVSLLDTGLADMDPQELKIEISGYASLLKQLAAGSSGASPSESAELLITRAELAISEAKQILGRLENPDYRKELERAILEEEAALETLKGSATPEALKDMADDQIATFTRIVNARIETLRTKAAGLLAAEKSGVENAAVDAGGLSLLELMFSMDLDLSEVATYAARSGFSIQGILDLFRGKGYTTQTFLDMMALLQENNMTVQELIKNGGVLDNAGSVGVVVDLFADQEAGMAAEITVNGTVYRFGGAMVLNNGAIIQLGNPLDHEDMTQQFGWVDMDTKGHSCFFSTVDSEVLGLFPGELLVSRDVVIEAKGGPVVYHFDEYGNPEYVGTLEEVDPNGTEIGRLFSEADYPNGLPLTIDLDSFPKEYLVHSFATTVLTDPTCEEEGLSLLACTGENCPLQMTQAIPALGHRWLEPSYTWTKGDDGWTCTAQQVCARNRNHPIVREGIIEVSETDPDCEIPGKRIYTATFEAPFTTQVSEVDIVPATGHVWLDDPKYDWILSDNGSWLCEAFQVCKNHEEHTNTLETVTAEITSSTADCENAGTATLTASFSVDGLTPQTKEVDVLATGHLWGTTPDYVWVQEGELWFCEARLICQNNKEHTLTQKKVQASVTSTTADCENDGTATLTASFSTEGLSDQTTEIDAPATGHLWGDVAYAWTKKDDGSWSCTAVQICKNNEQHVNPLGTGVITSQITEDPGCESTGKATLTAAFSEAGLTAQTKEVDVPATGHLWGDDVKYSWTEASDGSWACTAVQVCKNNAEHTNPLETGVITSQTTEDPDCENTGKATLTAAFSEAGLTAQTKEVDVPATGHVWGDVEYTWTEGANGAWTCTAVQVCKNNTEHTKSMESVTAEITSSTADCENAGKATLTATFSEEGLTAQTKEIDVPATDHVWGDVEYTWTEGNDGAWTCAAVQVCKNNTEHTKPLETVTAEITSSTADCEHSGKATLTATFSESGLTAQTKEIDVSATGHLWGEPEYAWTEGADGVWSCTAKRECANGDHPEMETVKASSSVTTPVTCDTDGAVTWTAGFENTAFTEQTKQVTIAAGHDWTIEYTWDDANATCTAVHVCGRDSSHNVTMKTVKAEITRTAACEQPGAEIWKAVFGDDELADQEKEVTVASTPHTYTDESIHYEWADDLSTCQGLLDCTRCDYVYEGPLVNTSCKVLTEPDCTTPGEGEFTAAFTAAPFTTQTKKGAIPEKGHDWETDEDKLSEEQFVWTIRGTGPVSATMTVYCRRNSEHSCEVNTNNIEQKVTAEPDIENDRSGTIEFTATFTLDGKSILRTLEKMYRYTPVLPDSLSSTPVDGMTVEQLLKITLSDNPARYNGENVEGVYEISGDSSYLESLSTDPGVIGQSVVVSVFFHPEKSNAFYDTDATITFTISDP